ncbi:MAG: RNA polymerase factor sigma-54 [Planctomycetaceae bacterium]
MQLSVSQQMKLGQQMKLAPRMIQSMEILQLPLAALQERIDQELAENITLEQVARDSEATSDTEVQIEVARAKEEATEKSADEKELVVDESHNNEADFERLLEISSEWPEDNIGAGTRPSSNYVDEAGDRAHDLVSNIESRSQTLQDHLLNQFTFSKGDDDTKRFGEYLIQNLDNHGRLQNSLPEIVQVYRMSGQRITQEQAEDALYRIQRLDPPGVGARDLSECLLLQIQPDSPCRDVLVTIITSHLEDVAQNRLPVIERKTGYSLDEIKAAIEELHHLNPRPGSGFEQRTVERVTPDLTVDRNENGRWTVQLIDEYVPNLRISRRYVKMLQNNPDASTKEFIKKKIESAKWIIDAIEQRYNTLKRVAQAIVDHQTAFLDNGPEHIVPLKMQQVADDVKVHVTTVSRAVDGKWIQTPRGIFPLKRFFGGGTQTAQGEDVAWENIRRKLKEIVDGEDKNKPLSDDALVEQLANHGFKLARRTVTKYRKAMDIPSSRQRREY